MNSELIVKLENLLEKYEGELKTYQDEYNELTDLTHVPSKKDLARMKQIRKEVSTLATDIKEMREDVNSLKEIDKTICDLTAVIQKNDGVTTKFAKEMKEQLLEEEKALEEAITNKWSELKPEKEETKEEEATEEKKVQAKPTSKKKLITIAALCAAIGILAGVVIGKGTSKKVKNVDNGTSITEVDKTKEEALEFTDINDEEEVYKRASLIKNEIDKNVPNNDYTIEEIENMLKWFNGGNVDEVSNEAALFATGRVEYLMNKENQGEVKEAFDVSKFFLDGSLGSKLAKEIHESKTSLMETKGKEEFTKNAEEFTKLLVNSWILNGTNNYVSSYVLETSGMKFLIDTYFTNTYAYIDVPNVRVIVNDAEFELDKVIEEANEANCEAKVTADNGETFTTYVNKLTSDLIGMVNEAAYNKENNNSLTLTK